MGEMMQPKEQHEIRTIEEATCELSNSVGDALGRANGINRFFFGVPEDKAKATESETPELKGWFESHIRVLRRINDRVQDICDALENIHEVIDKK